MKKKKRIAYLSNYSARDINSNSGLHYHMSNQLCKYFGKVDYYHPKGILLRLIDNIFRKIYRIQYGRGTLYENSIYNSLIYGIYFSIKLSFKKYDFVFISRGANIAAFLKTSSPIIYTSDTTFDLMYGYYPTFSFFPRSKCYFFDVVEKRAIHKSSALIYPSQWAAMSAIDYYNASKEKVHVIPSGANFEKDEVPSINDIRKRKTSSCCNLLFVGKNWKRKGGDIAYDVVEMMISKGIDTKLIVIGCSPPSRLQNNNNIEVVGFLDKNNEEEGKQLRQYYLDADFFILPTKGETFGIVFVEACAFGLPILAPDTGGVATIVNDKINGFLLPVTATPSDYTDKIIRIYNDKKLYMEMSIASRKKFDDLLNWDVWGASVFNVINQILEMKE